MGKGSWSHASAEKVPKLSPSIDELAGDLSRADGCVDEVLTCDFSVGPQCSEGSDPYGSVEKLMMVFSGSGEMGEVLPRSDGYGDEVATVGSLLVGSKSSEAKVGCLGDTMMVADSPAKDFPNFGAVLNSDGQSVKAELAVSPSLLVFELSDMIHHHKLLGKNCFSPLSELGFDSKEDELLLLD